VRTGSKEGGKPEEQAQIKQRRQNAQEKQGEECGYV
jgi:hypothetical protein